MTAMKRILIVEDEKDLARMMGFTLEKAGYAIDFAYDGVEGLEKAKTLKPDLITLDVMMPKMDGYELCQKLKADPDCSQIPILMVTIKDREEDIKKGFAAGANDYLPKAYDRDVLIAKVKKLIA